jgi:hypothetical protein
MDVEMPLLRILEIKGIKHGEISILCIGSLGLKWRAVVI